MATLWWITVSLYTLVAVAGLLLVGWTLWDDIVDLRAARLPGRNGINLRIAQRQIRATGATLAFDLVFAAAGVRTLIVARTPTSDVLTGALLVTVGFTVALGVLNGGLLLNQIERIQDRRSSGHP